jgi:hypothetical protein
MDMPPFDMSQKMVDLKIDTIAVYVKNKDAVKHSANITSATSTSAPSTKTKECTKVIETLETGGNINDNLRTDLDTSLSETKRKIEVTAEERISMDIVVQPKK